MVACRNSCTSSNPEIWDDRVFDPIFSYTLSHLDSLFPIVMELNYSELKPKEAIEKLLQPEKSRKSTNEPDRMYL